MKLLTIIATIFIIVGCGGQSPRDRLPDPSVSATMTEADTDTEAVDVESNITVSDTHVSVDPVEVTQVEEVNTTVVVIPTPSTQPVELVPDNIDHNPVDINITVDDLNTSTGNDLEDPVVPIVVKPTPEPSPAPTPDPSPSPTPEPTVTPTPTPSPTPTPYVDSRLNGDVLAGRTSVRRVYNRPTAPTFLSGTSKNTITEVIDPFHMEPVYNIPYIEKAEKETTSSLDVEPNQDYELCYELDGVKVFSKSGVCEGDTGYHRHLINAFHQAKDDVSRLVGDIPNEIYIVLTSNESLAYVRDYQQARGYANIYVSQSFAYEGWYNSLVSTLAHELHHVKYNYMYFETHPDENNVNQPRGIKEMTSMMVEMLTYEEERSDIPKELSICGSWNNARYQVNMEKWDDNKFYYNYHMVGTVGYYLLQKYGPSIIKEIDEAYTGSFMGTMMEVLLNHDQYYKDFKEDFYYSILMSDYSYHSIFKDKEWHIDGKTYKLSEVNFYTAPSLSGNPGLTFYNPGDPTKGYVHHVIFKRYDVQNNGYWEWEIKDDLLTIIAE